MAKEVGIEIPEYFLDELEIPEDFLKNNDFIIDLESCFNDLKRKNQNITEEQLRELLSRHIEVGRNDVTIYIERDGTKEIAQYLQVDQNTFNRVGMVRQAQTNSESEPIIYESIGINRLENNSAVSSYIASKERKIDSYTQGVQLIEDTNFEDVRSQIENEDSYWDEIEEQDFRSEEKPSLIDKSTYIAKKTGLGVASGIAGLYQAVLTESANQLNQGANMTAEEVAEVSKNAYTPKADITQSPVLPSMNNIIKRVPVLVPKVIDIWHDNEKSFTGKLGAIYTEYMSEVLNAIPAKQQFNSMMNGIGNVIPEAGKAVETVNNAISKPLQNANEALYYEGQEYGKITQTAGNVGQVVGNMAPSIAASIATGDPAISLGVMGLSAKGQSTQEALNRGAELNEAVKIGNAKAMVEVGTEMMFSGVNIFGKGALDDIIEKGILDKVKNEVGQELAKRGINVAGEVIEETISDVVGTYVDRGTVDPNAEYKLSDWSDTAVTTVLSTLVLNGITNTINRQAINNNQNKTQTNKNQTTELVRETVTHISPPETKTITALLNSELTLDSAVELLKIERDYYEPTLSNAIQYKLQNSNLSKQAQQIFANDQIANQVYESLLERPYRIEQIEQEIANNVELQQELEERRLNNTGNIDEYMAVYIETIEQNNKKKYYGIVNDIEQENIMQPVQKSSKSSVKQITETQNKLYVEYDGFFRDFETAQKDFKNIENKYAAQNFLKGDIDIILKDYNGEKVSLELAEATVEKLKQITPGVDLKGTELEIAVDVLSSVNKNINVQEEASQSSSNTDISKLQEALFSNQTNSEGLTIVQKTALELYGIESRNVKAGENTYSQIKIDEKWYNLDSILEAAKLKEVSNETKPLPQQISERINQLAERNGNTVSVSNTHGNQTMIEKAKNFFNKNQEIAENDMQYQYETVVNQENNSPDFKIVDYSPADTINDKILWEIKTWDTSEVDNKIDNAFVLLPNTGTPQQIYEQNPEMFSQLYKSLLSETKGKKTPFIGSIEYMEDLETWTACTTDSAEMQRANEKIKAAIINKVAQNAQIKKFEEVYKNINYEAPRTTESSPTLQPQVNLEETNTSNDIPKTERRNETNQESQLYQNNAPDTIVISDLHSRMDRWEFVNQMMKQNPNLNVIILGDAMDRGSYGVEMLLQIKELSDVGRVRYVPGNHDEFAYDFLRGKIDGNTKNNSLYDYGYKSMELNKGGDTIQKLQNFNQTVENALKEGLITKRVTIEELTEWLGSQPIQMRARYGENSYALAHAFFDPKLYQYDSQFNLEKAYDLQMKGENANNSAKIKRFKNTLWYREKTPNTHYAPINWPTRHAMVVGHTPQSERSKCTIFR